LGNLKGCIQLGDLHVGGDNSDLELREIGCVAVYWIELIKNRIQWQPAMEMVMNLQYLQKEDIFLLAE
jgi:hypothetical protein